VRRRAAARGAALVLVLVVTVLLGLMAVAVGFTVTLDGLAARTVQDAALAEGQAEGALQLAAAEAGRSMESGVAPPEGSVGPWSAAGITTTARVTPVDGDAVISVDARVGRAAARRSLRFRWQPALSGTPWVVLLRR